VSSPFITALVLAGGFGTRLRPAFAGPKVLAPVQGRPFITYLLDRLETAGIRRVVLCTGYLAGEVKAALGERHGRLILHHSPEPAPLGTGGALRNALALSESDPVLVLNGDSWCDFHLPTMLAMHRARYACATIWLTPVDWADRFGRVELGAGGAIAGFAEKGRSGPGWVNAGAYLLSRELLESIPLQCAVSLEREVFPSRVGRGLFGCAAGRSLLDIGVPDAYRAAAGFIKRTAARASAIWGGRRAVLLDRDGTICIERGYISDPAQIELLPAAAAGMRRLRELGLRLIVTTNQAAVGRGGLTAARLNQIHRRLQELLRAQGVALEAIYVCPHRPDQGCNCRKPAPEMALRAARELNFDPRASFVVGDKPCDIGLGLNVGATSFLVTTGYGAQVLARRESAADYVVDSLTEMAQVVEHLIAAGSPHHPAGIEQRL
jgi:D-glycero-alpha-D-manno-heptose 1-phosphate guanylyltransferase